MIKILNATTISVRLLSVIEKLSRVIVCVCTYVNNAKKVQTGVIIVISIHTIIIFTLYEFAFEKNITNIYLYAVYVCTYEHQYQHDNQTIFLMIIVLNTLLLSNHEALQAEKVTMQLCFSKWIHSVFLQIFRNMWKL